MRLSHRDFDQLQRTILEMHDQPQLEPFRQAVPGLFHQMIPADWFALGESEVDIPKKRVKLFAWWGTCPVLNDDLIERMERVAFDHPFSRYTFETRDPTALKFSDFFSTAQLQRAELYNEFYRHVNTGRFLATAVPSPRGLTTINAARPLKSSDFTERDRLIMNLLRPHFDVARRAAELNTARVAAKVKPLESYGLTPREREVATWLARGKTNVEIGLILQTRTRTVEKHVESVLGKLGVHTRTAAALVLSHAM